MLKFLAAKSNASNGWAEMAEQQRFTRFENKEKRFTRFKTHDIPTSARPDVSQPPTTPPQRATPEMNSEKVMTKPQAPVTHCHIDERAHLYASTDVPLGILKKALPMRFARLDKEGDDVVIC
jgi:hypothetical protein